VTGCIAHLSRAGWLRFREKLADKPLRPGKSPLELRVHLDDGSGFDLTEAGTKKRMAVYVVRDPLEVPGIARLGTDPLDPAFDSAALGALLAAHPRSQIKGLLRDQSLIAGVGNAYSDEALHVAKMSPYRLAGSLDETAVVTLHDSLVTTLRDAVERSRGLPAAELKDEKRAGMRVHGRAGQACPVCGDTVREVSFADRAMQYCPTCQTGGKLLADRRLSRLLK
jgi:formamidopyrimidine-DNA glycosylase